MKSVIRPGLGLVAAVALVGCQADMTAPAVSRTLGSAPNAAITFDPETGNGFVGKGDVQAVYANEGVNANNKWLQDNAGDVDFRAFSASGTEITWTCENDGSPPAQNKERTTTTTFQGLLTSVARENSKGKDGPVTGFNLNGWEGTPTSQTTTKGPKAPIWDEDTQMWLMDSGTCPSSSSPFYLEQESVVVTTFNNGGGLQVTLNGTDWFDIPVPIVP